MIKEGNFGPSEAIVLITTSICIKVFFSSPAILVNYTGTSAWYAETLSGLVALIFFGFICKLYKRFPGCDLVDIYKESLGKILGCGLAFIFAVYLFFVAETSLCELYQILRVYVYPLSPNWYLSGLFVVSLYIVCLLGLESLARVAKLLVYFMLVGVILILVFSYGNYNVNNLYPILGYGIGETLKHGVLRSSIFGEVLLLLVFARSLQGYKFVKREGIISIIISTILVSLVVLSFLMSYPYYRLREITAPMYELTTLISFGRFFGRVESGFLLIWIIGTLISVSLVFYAFIWLYCKLFNISDKKPVVLSGCIILFLLSLMQKDIVTVITRNISYLRTYGSIPFFIFPLLALIVASIRGKRGKPNEDKKCEKA